ncbi:RimJ/RimL family protein N-acetyltransferase [Sinobacterium caligoides]|uniref:RimJ/RimL family protein N-acetyltransferase n=1 Tax=Sinobacterium caligoides TaxID=933926 RepID=A0A3N2DDU6_9GAMM|nr:GNAT family N-acetyltransferase [Sinobacterium caligoides]ROR97965.1 RimJ/RimL family protein N-acetyltransferase [Sinobacterium caligoides]
MPQQTDRVSLRYATADDAAVLFHYTGDVTASKFLARKPHSSPGQTAKMLARLSTEESLADHGLCVWVIQENSSGSVLGMITVVESATSVALHFGLLSSATGQGFASEALRLAADSYAAEADNKSIISFTDQENLAAQHSLTSADFHYTGSQAAFYVAPQLSNAKRDVFCYAYKHDEW